MTKYTAEGTAYSAGLSWHFNGHWPEKQLVCWCGTLHADLCIYSSVCDQQGWHLVSPPPYDFNRQFVVQESGMTLKLSVVGHILLLRYSHSFVDTQVIGGHSLWQWDSGIKRCDRHSNIVSNRHFFSHYSANVCVFGSMMASPQLCLATTFHPGSP